MTGHEIRQAFLEYFRRQGHTVVPSSPLIPQNDPTLLFTNAGMVQFKDVFLGHDTRPYQRAATCQKCVRAGGKHNDLEQVGHTARHHTFFEMLGNFSFGNYFKADAIRYGWEFLTEYMKLPKDRLWVTIYTNDDEADKLWREIGVTRIVRLGEKDNFWSMGEVGPCGPCSEILYDQGPAFSCGKSGCQAGCDCDRYLELWNLVFMQFNRDSEGELHALPRPSIDTGMGLERITAVVQGAPSNFDSDLFRPIIHAIADLAGLDYQNNHKHDVSMRVVADHARAATFLIGDRVIPANDGRGYVLRRIIRRAVRHGKLLGIDKPFLYKMSGVVIDKMQDAYPELTEHREYIASLILNEEERFIHTLGQGLKILGALVDEVKLKDKNLADGKEIFKLYDTYGFPVDLSREILQENGLSFGQSEFDAAMQEQQDMARKHWKGAAREIKPVYLELTKDAPIEFDRENEKLTTQILAVIQNGQLVGATQDKAAEIVLQQTPFYAEKGGQEADNGWIISDSGRFKVENVLEVMPGLIVHQGVTEQGSLKKGELSEARIDHARRKNIACHHTATHILHAVLRQVLGDHVKQAGSLVASDRLRFDFTHFTGVSRRELARIESLVNENIITNYSVATQEMELEEAIASGAMALFDEKYGQSVRVVSVGEVSKELCGGTHVQAGGEIGLFKIVSESSIAAGVRRIEAVCAKQAFALVTRESELLLETAGLLRCTPSEIAAKTEKLLDSLKQQEKELSRLKDKMASGQVSDLLDKVREIKGVKVLALKISDVSDVERLRSLGDLLKQRMGSGLIVLGAEINQKVALLAIVTPDLIPKLHAGNIIKQVAQITGGSGGGRPDMAQAGGKDVDKLPEAIERVYDIAGEVLKFP
ncbi:MAG: alanine--tRNA ligase [Candidatus Schekmanbacteria bacterium]|nr:alanine--tRNA ligase [Candidatus Schekmanbacteria bacterium]